MAITNHPRALYKPPPGSLFPPTAAPRPPGPLLVTGSSHTNDSYRDREVVRFALCSLRNIEKSSPLRAGIHARMDSRSISRTGGVYLCRCVHLVPARCICTRGRRWVRMLVFTCAKIKMHALFLPLRRNTSPPGSDLTGASITYSPGTTVRHTRRRGRRLERSVWVTFLERSARAWRAPEEMRRPSDPLTVHAAAEQLNVLTFH